jgi:predicted metallo-beta-lactamase superfamily hydrolase
MSKKLSEEIELIFYVSDEKFKFTADNVHDLGKKLRDFVIEKKPKIVNKTTFVLNHKGKQATLQKNVLQTRLIINNALAPIILCQRLLTIAK